MMLSSTTHFPMDYNTPHCERFVDNVDHLDWVYDGHPHQYKSGISRNWAKEGCGPYPAETYNQYMTRSQFKTVSQYFHFYNYETAIPPGQSDKLKKERFLLNVIKKHSRRRTSWDCMCLSTKVILQRRANMLHVHNSTTKNRRRGLFCCS